MRIDYINPFVEATYDILTEVLDDEVTKEKLALKETTQPMRGVATFVGLAGSVKGRVLIDMSKETAINISNVMNGIDEKKTEIDELTRSTISELVNMMVGRAITKLHDLGFSFLMSTPILLSGSNMEMSNLSIEAFVVPIKTPHGEIEVNVAIKEVE